MLEGRATFLLMNTEVPQIPDTREKQAQCSEVEEDNASKFYDSNWCVKVESSIANPFFVLLTPTQYRNIVKTEEDQSIKWKELTLRIPFHFYYFH